MLLFKFILLLSLIVLLAVGGGRWVGGSVRPCRAVDMCIFHDKIAYFSVKPKASDGSMAAGTASGIFFPVFLFAPPTDGVNFKPSVTPFSCHDVFRGFGRVVCVCFSFFPYFFIFKTFFFWFFAICFLAQIYIHHSHCSSGHFDGNS